MKRKRTHSERLAYQRKWRKEHAAQHLAITNAYRDSHRTEINSARRKRYREDIVGALLTQARKRAKIANIPFDLTRKDIEIPKVCPVLGIRLQIGTGRQQDSSPSIDRFNPGGGYTKQNVVVMSLRANRIKNDATYEELLALTRWMEEHKR